MCFYISMVELSKQVECSFIIAQLLRIGRWRSNALKPLDGDSGTDKGKGTHVRFYDR